MNTTTAACKWNCNINEVRIFCREGLIPYAYKKGKTKWSQWEIPDKQDKPPVRRHVAVKLMQDILLIKQGASIKHEAFDKEIVYKVYCYLCKNGFIRGFTDLNNLGDASLTIRGEELIEWHKKASESKVSVRGELEGGIPLMHAKIEINKE